MPAAENPKVGGCYIWLISCLLFICTISGAIFLVLYMTETQSTPSTYFYPIIGVSLVCLPWFFWLLTFLYRLISRALGFRFICFGPFGSDHPNDNDAIARQSNGLGLSSNVTVNNTTGTHSADDGDEESKIEDQSRSESREPGIPRQPGSPRRVHFGGVVIIGEENESVEEKTESPRRSSSSSSSSSSSARSMQSNESEMPLRLSMA